MSSDPEPRRLPLADRVRAVLDKPLAVETPEQRRRLMLIATVVIVGAALIFALFFNDNAAQNGEPERGTARTAPVAPPPVAAAAPEVPLPAELPNNPPTVAREERDRATSVAKSFTRDYLAFGRRSLTAEEISDATDELRDRIASLPRGRGTPAVREHPARLQGVSARVVDKSTIVVTATIARLGARYPLRMTVKRDDLDGQWAVAALALDQ
ncbi:MAG: hypothetical protein LC798_05540 [Chloroflexi bacterium]|nr:hypothetical protein [Chloroflexota bacterium]